MESATAYRQQLLALIASSDPQRQDRALDEIVLVGHSMGGLISKMQVCSSENVLWNEFSRAPISSVKASPEMLAKIDAAFFFEPVPNVSRVVYIAAPFGGSPMAYRPAALIGKSLVRLSEEEDREWREFVRDNWDILMPYFHRRTRPTTIDLLKPRNPLLDALGRMQVSPRVRAHAIVGEGYFFPALRRGDSIVPVSSARIPDVLSETFLKYKHTGIHRSIEASQEVERILEEHYAEFSSIRGEAAQRSPDNVATKKAAGSFVPLAP